MKKYSVLLVDDEEDVVEAIVQKIDWEGLGYSLAGYAKNGLEALEIAEEKQIDVVLTDIKMPYMDGLTLSHRLKELYPSIKIIIFSGFDEFEYAKEAIRLEAEEYMLKPVDAGELSRVFQKVHDALDQEFDEKQSIHRLKNYYLESLPILQESFYTSLIEGTLPQQDMESTLLDYQISLPGKYYAVVILHNSLSLSPEGINPLLITMSIRKLAEERLQKNWRPCFFTYLGNTLLIAQLDRETDSIKLTDDCEILCRMAKHVCKATVTAGIGKTVSHLVDLPLSYLGARDAVAYRVLYGRGKAIAISEIGLEGKEERNVNKEIIDEERLLDIYRSIRMSSEEELDKCIDLYVENSHLDSPSLQEYHFFLMDLVTNMHKFLLSNQMDTNLIFPKEEDVYQKVQQFSLAELSQWLKEVCKKIQRHIQEMRSDKTKSFVKRAVEHVHSHYMDKDLTVEALSQELHVSAAYFSTVFKRETGKSFINYLTDYRMEKAIRLLMEEEEKTYIIAESVGYSDPNYFSYAFKKKFGMSPSKYKSGGKGKEVL
jgi:response regulator receiver protein